MTNIEIETHNLVHSFIRDNIGYKRKRLSVAAQILASLAPSWNGTDEDLAKRSVEMAEALIEAAQ